MNIERLQQTIREISASGLTPVVLRGAYVLLPYTVQNAQDLHALFERDLHIRRIERLLAV